MMPAAPDMTSRGESSATTVDCSISSMPRVVSASSSSRAPMRSAAKPMPVTPV
jgi:hypothetical protein